jgi:hypothetical protein
MGYRGLGRNPGGLQQEVKTHYNIGTMSSEQHEFSCIFTTEIAEGAEIFFSFLCDLSVLCG